MNVKVMRLVDTNQLTKLHLLIEKARIEYIKSVPVSKFGPVWDTLDEAFTITAELMS